MNRFKKYVQSKGIKLEHDYPYLPFDLGSQSIEAVIVNAETATVREVLLSLIGVIRFDREGEMTYDID